MNIIEETVIENFCIEGVDVDGDGNKKEETEIIFEDSSAVGSKFKDKMRIIVTKLNNVLNDYRMPNPQKVSLEKWNTEFFRVRHQKWRVQESQAENSLGRIKESFETAIKMLESVSIGMNRGVGGMIVIEEVQRNFEEVLRLRKVLIVQTAVTEKIMKVANNHPDSKILKGELRKDVYEIDLKNKLLLQAETWESLLREAVDMHIQEYKKKKDVQFFSLNNDLYNYKKGEGSVELQEWWYDGASV